MHASLVSQINVVPYIDVMLVLLIIFMITAPMFSESKIQLPEISKASQNSINHVKLELIIEISKQQEYILKTKEAVAQKMHIEKLNSSTNSASNSQSNLQSFYSLRTLMIEIKKTISRVSLNDLTISIAADKDIKYQIVVSLIDELNRLGIKNMALSVHHRQ